MSRPVRMKLQRPVTTSLRCYEFRWPVRLRSAPGRYQFFCSAPENDNGSKNLFRREFMLEWFAEFPRRTPKQA